MRICSPQAVSVVRWAALILLLGCKDPAQAQVPPSEFSIPAPPNSAQKSLSLWATHYNIERVDATSSGLALRDPAGRPISAHIPERDWCLGAIEGTVQILSRGRLQTYNFVDIGNDVQVDCAATLRIDPRTRPWISSIGKSRFTLARGAYGDGVQGFILVPYRTIAVDPSIIPIGSTVYIPRARGMRIVQKVPLGLIHDGYFYAADRGGAIKGTHIDIFCGAEPGNCLPQLITSDETQPIDAYLVQNAKTVETLRRLHSAP